VAIFYSVGSLFQITAFVEVVINFYVAVRRMSKKSIEIRFVLPLFSRHSESQTQSNHFDADLCERVL